MWHLKDGKVQKAAEGVEWSFPQPKKADVLFQKDFVTLAEVIEQQKAQSVARHTPETFPEGVAPRTFSCPAPLRFVPENAQHMEVLQLCSKLASVSLLWAVKVKNNQVVPGGLVLKVNKQLIPRNDEPLCLT